VQYVFILHFRPSVCLSLNYFSANKASRERKAEIDNIDPLVCEAQQYSLEFGIRGIDGLMDFGWSVITLASSGPRLDLICFPYLHRLSSTVVDCMLIVGKIPTGGKTLSLLAVSVAIINRVFLSLEICLEDL
jgi:hypothetical protein